VRAIRALLPLTLIFLAALAFGQEPVTQAPPPVEFPAWRLVSSDDDAAEYIVTFPSSMPSMHPQNDIVPVRIFVPAMATKPVPVVIMLHYWGASDLRGERALAQELNQRGIAAAAVILPYHMERTPPGRRSGEMAIQSNVDALKTMTVQSVQDVRRAVDFLVTRPEFDSSRIGIMGTSLGALITALTYGVEPRVDSATFVLGGIDYAGIIWSSSKVVIQRDIMRRSGYTVERLRDELAEVEPGRYLPRREKGSTFVLGAKFDSVVPTWATSRLIETLDNPKVLWMDTGHYGGIFVQRRMMREVAAFFDAEFSGSSYVVPPRLAAPTFRLGIQADARDGFNLAAGVDVLSFDARRNGYATLLITPRGPGMFIGARLFGDFAGGVILTPRSGSVGVYWNIVL
jgi:hypothetical protein